MISFPGHHTSSRLPRTRSGTAAEVRRGGFTLVELIIVILILGILVVLVIPLFTASTDDARLARMQANLVLIEQAIQRYRLDHDKLPDHRIRLQLSQFTRGDGTPSPTKGPPFHKGPFLVPFPPNPLAPPGVDPSSVSVVDTAAPLTPDANPATGWKYSSVTGEIIANIPE